MLREGDQVKSTSDIHKGWLEGGPADVSAGRRGVVVEEHHGLLGESHYDVAFDAGGLLEGAQEVREVREREVERHYPFFEYEPPARNRRPSTYSSGGDAGGELVAILAIAVAVIAAIFAVGVLIAGTVWAPLVGLEQGWPDGSVTGHYFGATLGLIALVGGVWVLAGLRRPQASPNRRTARIAIGSTLVVGSLVVLFFVLPSAVRSELRQKAEEARTQSTATSTEASPIDEEGESPSGESKSGGPGASETDGPPATTRLDEWPRGKEAFTVQLASTPSLEEARQAVREARDHGLTPAILYSSHYPKLPTGYYIVFDGAFGTRDEADAHLDAARAVRADAFTRWISPAGDEAPRETQAPGENDVGQGDSSAGGDDPDVAPVTFEAASFAAFAIDVPSGWDLSEEAMPHGPFERTEWREPEDPETRVFVDFAPEYRLSPEEAATRARSKLTATSSAPYEERAFTATTMNDVAAWKWVYTLGDVQRAHYFVQGCRGAYAVRGSAPATSFASYEEVFSQMADSLSPAC